MAKKALLAKLTTQDGKRDQLLAAIADQAMANAAGEPGTEIYAAHKDENDPNVVWFYELYSDEAALAAHGSSEGLKEFGKSIRDLMAGRPELIHLEPASAKGISL